ncbi:MAG: helix-turn-helix domain-containing protein [Sphingobacterium sp.]|jgi:AraC-like DNA-binding protein|nr:helix-turn-helix domain-containing protein [Sphingobacterium sp.]
MKNANFPIYEYTSYVERVNSKDRPILKELRGPRQRDVLHKDDFCSLFLIESGKGAHIIDFIKYECKEAQLHLIFPGCIHSLGLEEGALVQQLMIHRNDFRIFVDQLKFIFSLYQKYPVLDLSADGKDKLSHVFLGIKKELYSGHPNRDILRADLAILAEIINGEIFHQLQHTEYYGNPILFEFISLIDIHFKEEKLPSFYAGKMNITVNYLNTLCIKFLSQTASSVIHERIINEAKKLLFIRDFSIKEISLGLGYTDPSYFARFFKSVTGITPTRYKEI